MVQRLTYRRRLSYNTASNKTKVSKTPGGRLVYLYRKKQGSIPRCGDTGVKLKGVSNFKVDLSYIFIKIFIELLTFIDVMTDQFLM